MQKRSSIMFTSKQGVSMNKLSIQKRAQIIGMLVEGMSLRATSRLADCSINIAIRPWTSVNDFGLATAEINQAVAEQLRAANISIPFPQREVRLLNS